MTCMLTHCGCRHSHVCATDRILDAESDFTIDRILILYHVISYQEHSSTSFMNWKIDELFHRFGLLGLQFIGILLAPVPLVIYGGARGTTECCLLALLAFKFQISLSEQLTSKKLSTEPRVCVGNTLLPSWVLYCCAVHMCAYTNTHTYNWGVALH